MDYYSTSISRETGSSFNAREGKRVVILLKHLWYRLRWWAVLALILSLLLGAAFTVCNRFSFGQWAPLVILLVPLVFIVLSIRKFLRDNMAIARQLIHPKLLLSFLLALVRWIPYLVLLLPGYFLANCVDQGVAWSIDRMESWSDDKVTEIQVTIDNVVNVPLEFYRHPIDWLRGKTQTVKIPYTTTSRMVEKTAWWRKSVFAVLSQACWIFSIFVKMWFGYVVLRSFGRVWARQFSKIEACPAISFQRGFFT